MWPIIVSIIESFSMILGDKKIRFRRKKNPGHKISDLLLPSITFKFIDQFCKANNQRNIKQILFLFHLKKIYFQIQEEVFQNKKRI